MKETALRPVVRWQTIGRNDGSCGKLLGWTAHSRVSPRGIARVLTHPRDAASAIAFRSAEVVLDRERPAAAGHRTHESRHGVAVARAVVALVGQVGPGELHVPVTIRPAETRVHDG